MPSPMQSSTLQYYAYWKQYYVFLKENEPKVLTQLYIEKLFRNQVPVIWNLQHLSELLGVKISTLGHMISKPHAFYRHFEIPKRQGGSRQISAPQPVLLEAQRWIKLHILQELPLHPAAKGFRRQQSICSNAAPHLGRPYLLKMDLKNFFPSISMHRVISVFRHLGYSEKVAYALAALCCSRQALPQGAASSPDLSNHIARRLDARLSGLARRFDLVYTRYADDLTFSAVAPIPRYIRRYVEEIVSEEGFAVNGKKTKWLRPGQPQCITGISVASGTLKVPKARKRALRQAIHYVGKYGLLGHLQHRGQRDVLYLERLRGYLHFWQHVEPQHPYLEKGLGTLRAEAARLTEKWDTATAGTPFPSSY